MRICTQKLLNISIPITAVGWSNKAVHTNISYVSLRWLQFCRLVISFPKQVFEKKIFPFVSICLSRLYELVSDGREMWTSVKWITVCSWVLIAFWSMTLDRIVCFSRFKWVSINFSWIRCSKLTNRRNKHEESKQMLFQKLHFMENYVSSFLSLINRRLKAWNSITVMKLFTVPAITLIVSNVLHKSISTSIQQANIYFWKIRVNA